jgi:hypothetical protein
MLYFLLHDADAFHRRLVPALAASWRRRDFGPLADLAAELIPALDAFADRYHLTAAEEPLLKRLTAALPFDRRLWRHLAGEVLLYAAADAPALQTAPDTLAALLAPGQPGRDEWPLDRLAPILQAHHGSRDLDFGGVIYRPGHAGLNDAGDVARLADDLAAVDPARWTVDDLRAIPDLNDEDERAEELAFARDCFAALRALYGQARERGRVVVCEEI